MYRAVVPACILTLMLLPAFLGCQGSGNNPVTTDPGLNQSGITFPDNSSKLQTREYLWAIYDIKFNPSSGELEIIPARTPLFEANITRFLQPPGSPINLLSFIILPETDLQSGYFACNITIKHPFPGTKFCGFDVKGIIMGENGIPCQWDESLVYTGLDGVRLLNADGWSRWWNQVEFTSYDTIFGYTEGVMAGHQFDSTSTLNPYKYFSDELGTDSPLDEITDSGRGFFSCDNPGLNTRRYEIQFPSNPYPTFHFKYAISASWAKPRDDASAPWNQDDFDTNANQAEPFRLEITDNGSTAFYENESSYGGDLNLSLGISDWQLLDGGTIEDEITSVFIESPTLFDGVVDALEPGSISSGIMPMSFNLSVTIEDVTPTSTVDQVLIIHVTSAEPSTYEPQIPDATGFDWPEAATLAAHLIWEVPVSSINPDLNKPPVADASASNPTEGPVPLMVHLDPSNSYDPDGTIVLFEWDFNNDGSYDVSTSAPDITLNQFVIPGENPVNLRVTDNEGLEDELDEPLIIYVYPSPSWSQLQNTPNHVGDVTDEIDLYPPLELLWSASMDSENTYWIEGSPIVGEGYVMVLYPDFSRSWAECFELETGDQVWKIPINTNTGSGYIGTPTGCFGEGRFYAPGNKIRALDPATGDEIWTYNPDSYQTMRHGLVYDSGRILVHLGEDIHIIDASTGNLQDTINVGSGYANYQPFTLRNEIAYVQKWGMVEAYDLTSGVLLWTFNVDPPYFGTDSSVRCAPTVPGDGNVYFGCYNAYYYAVDESSGGLTWKTLINGGTQRNFDTSAVADGLLYFGECRGNGSISRLVCLDTDDGEELWDYSHPDANALDFWATTSPIVVNGVVYAGNSNGEFVGCDASTGDLLFSHMAPDSASSDPVAIDNKLLFLSDDGTLWCFTNAG